jgi:hypothetical protein
MDILLSWLIYVLHSILFDRRMAGGGGAEGGGGGEGEGEGETNTNQDYVLLAGGQTGKMHIHIYPNSKHIFNKSKQGNLSYLAVWDH